MDLLPAFLLSLVVAFGALALTVDAADLSQITDPNMFIEFADDSVFCRAGFLLNDAGTACVASVSPWGQVAEDPADDPASWAKTIYGLMLGSSRRLKGAPPGFAERLEDVIHITRAVADDLCTIACGAALLPGQDFVSVLAWWGRPTANAPFVSPALNVTRAGGLCACAFGQTTVGTARGFPGSPAVPPCSQRVCVPNMWVVADGDPDRQTPCLSNFGPLPANGVCVPTRLPATDGTGFAPTAGATAACYPGWAGANCDVDIAVGACSINGTCTGSDKCRLGGRGTTRVPFVYHIDAAIGPSSMMVQRQGNGLCSRMLDMATQDRMLCDAKLLPYGGPVCEGQKPCMAGDPVFVARDFNLGCLPFVSGRLSCYPGFSGPLCE